MEPSEIERAEYEEFLRQRKAQEMKLTLRKVMPDLAHGGVDRASIKRTLEYAQKVGAVGVLVAPSILPVVRRNARVPLLCRVGGNGEWLFPVLKKEVKTVRSLGAKGIVLTPCRFAVEDDNLPFLKRIVKKLKRKVKGGDLFLSVEDKTLTEEHFSLLVRSAREGGASGIVVSGETEKVVSALEKASGLQVIASGVENAEQLRLLLKSGVTGVISHQCDVIESELSEIN